MNLITKWVVGFFSKLGTIGVIFAGAAIIILGLLAPFFYIWALNTLFPALAIAYTWETWLAMYLLVQLIPSSPKDPS